MLNIINLRAELRAKANPKKAKLLQRFFKTGKGEYGEGDIFLGIMVPQTREVVKKYKDLKLSEIGQLLKSKIHEERQTALFILVEQFNQSRGVVMHHNTGHNTEYNTGQGVVINHHTMLKHSILKHSAVMCSGVKQGVVLQHNTQAKKIFEFYLKNTKHINNWDLVDLSAPKIVGEYLLKFCLPKEVQQILYGLTKSKNLWERRIAVLATFMFIRENRFTEFLKIAEMLLRDKEDLIHKAVGWMLREVGKRSQSTLEKFLKKHASKMPRVMLRYATEKLPEVKR